MNYFSLGIHSNAQQCLLHRYNHNYYHCYWYIWVPRSLNVARFSLLWGATYKPHRRDIYHWNRFICIHVLFCKYNHWLVVRSFFYHWWVFCQGKLCWCIIHVIAPPQFCGFVVLWQHITLPNNPCWLVPYYELVLQQFGSPPVYHVRYISLWFKEFLQSTTIWQYCELWSPQVLSKISYGPPYCICISYKAMSWLFQWQHCWSWDEIYWL